MLGAVARYRCYLLLSAPGVSHSHSMYGTIANHISLLLVCPGTRSATTVYLLDVEQLTEGS